MTAPLLTVRGLRKTFGGAHALDGVDLQVEAGTVHGLLGANGSGKSTLIKVLAGYHEVDGGTVSVRGEPVQLPLPAGAPQALGLAFVHQDLGLVPSLSALENYFIGALATSQHRMRVPWRALRRAMHADMERYELELDPRVPVQDMRPVDRALLAIVRAIESPGTPVTAPNRLVILDEPTVFLPRAEVARLFELVRRVAASGSSVLFVSHDLDEVREITDQITVLRNGKVALHGPTAELPADALIEAIVGGRLSVTASHSRPAESSERPLLAVERLAAGAVDDVSFTARAGEIVGLTGLLGSGYDDVVRALAGAMPARSGTARVAAQSVQLSSWTARKAVLAGVVLIPGDRLHEGAVTDLRVTDNVTMTRLGDHMRRGVLSRRAMTTRARTLADTFDVRPRDPNLLFGKLSGGNQQKVVLAKWLQTPPNLLLLHEPTQGVDVGARQQIFETIRSAVRGRVALCASSDHDQLAQLCDRVLVLRRGRVAVELAGDALTKSRITEECLRVGQERIGAQ